MKIPLPTAAASLAVFSPEMAIPIGAQLAAFLLAFAAGAAFTESVFILIIAFLLKQAGLFNTLQTVLAFFILLITAALFARRGEDGPPIN